MNDQESVMSIDLGVTNTFQQVDKFSNTESVTNKDKLYVLVKTFLDRSDMSI